MIKIAKQAALEAGSFLKEHYGQVSEKDIRRKSKNDFLSFVDEQSEQIIVETIRSRYPEHMFLAEEGGGSGNHSDYRWIIDPLDGTRNYLSGIPVFAVSIALEYEQELVMGIVYDPVRGELFEAQKEQGSFLNNNPITVSKKHVLAESFIATGFPFKSKQFLKSYLNAFEQIFKNSIGMRRLGAAAIDLAYVAAGRFDGFWEIGLQPWDIAAGALLIREAGGMVQDFWGSEDFLNKHYMLASNGFIQSEIREILQLHFPSHKPVYST